eukprot:2092109-Prymnesium_polylepis.1
MYPVRLSLRSDLVLPPGRALRCAARCVVVIRLGGETCLRILGTALPSASSDGTSASNVGRSPGVGCMQLRMSSATPAGHAAAAAVGSSRA